MDGDGTIVVALVGVGVGAMACAEGACVGCVGCCGCGCEAGLGRAEGRVVRVPESPKGTYSGGAV